MAAAAKVVEVKEPELVAPDMSRPMRLKYWQPAETIGTHTQRNVMDGGSFNDGCGTSGKVQAIWFYPALGYAVAEIAMGFRPGQLDQPDVIVKRVFLTNGHGREA